MSVHMNIHDGVKIRESEHYYPKCDAGPFWEVRFDVLDKDGNVVASIGVLGDNDGKKLVREVK